MVVGFTDVFVGFVMGFFVVVVVIAVGFLGFFVVVVVTTGLVGLVVGSNPVEGVVVSY